MKLEQRSQAGVAVQGEGEVNDSEAVTPAPRGGERVLVIDDASDVLDVVSRILAPEWSVVVAKCAESAWRACQESGPFGVIVCDYDLGGSSGDDFLQRAQLEWPDTVAVLLTAMADLDVAIQALHRGRIFRFLEKPCPRERLLAAVREAVDEHRSRRRARLRSSELEFVRNALETFNGSLERRIGEQATAIVRLHEYVGDLNTCETLQDVADRTAEVCFDLCGQRGTFVEILDASRDGERRQAQRGPVLSGQRVTQAIESHEGRLGSLVIDDSASWRKLSRDQRTMLVSVAASCAVAARNQIRRRERDEAQHATILALARLAERRDNETGKHLERVSLFCRLVAEGLRDDGCYVEQITDEFVSNLVRSAPLHDIGKVGIPDAILLKPGKLTPEEWTVMKRHTEIGAETLRGVLEMNSSQRFLETSLEIAWCHHEKWDGSGYPRGLAGEAIPLSARILALADVYDALTTSRPYKKPWSHADALQWIVSGSGAHFDPHAVAAFVARADQADAIRAALADTDEDVAKAGRVVG